MPAGVAFIFGVGVALLALLAYYAGRIHDQLELYWAAQSGVAHLTDFASAEEASAAWLRWEAENASLWPMRRADLTGYLIDRVNGMPIGMRRLLELAADADLGERQADWKYWYENELRIRRGRPPHTTRAQAVELTLLWRAPVGLTNAASTIVPVDGRIYVGSLGSALGDVRDEADGLVVVDGRSGTAEMLFRAPDKPPREIVGVAAAVQRVFVSCANGWVYALDERGGLQWKANAGSPLCEPPVLIDSGRAELDVVVVCVSGRVVSLDSASGKQRWATQIGAARGATLKWGLSAGLCAAAVGDVFPGGTPELIVTGPAGELHVLRAGDGRSQWQRKSGGPLSARACFGDGIGTESRVLSVTRDCGLWSMGRSGGQLRSTQDDSFLIYPGFGAPLFLRSIRSGDGTPDALVGIAADAAGAPTALAMVRGGSVLWRVPCGVDVLGAPAVANLNADRESEIVLVGHEVGPDGATSAYVQVFSRNGQRLLYEKLESAVAAPPVIADVDGDGQLELLIADLSGWLSCFRTSSAGPVEWGLARGDPHNSNHAANAYSYSQTPTGYQSAWRPRY